MIGMGLRPGLFIFVIIVNIDLYGSQVLIVVMTLNY
jgi:hypothetical protein